MVGWGGWEVGVDTFFLLFLQNLECVIISVEAM